MDRREEIIKVEGLGTMGRAGIGKPGEPPTSVVAC
jgi:hypothetical protein